MAGKKVNDRSFIRYLNRLWYLFDKVTIIIDNAAYHDLRRVRRYLERTAVL